MLKKELTLPISEERLRKEFALSSKGFNLSSASWYIKMMVILVFLGMIMVMVTSGRGMNNILSPFWITSSMTLLFAVILNLMLRNHAVKQLTRILGKEATVKFWSSKSFRRDEAIARSKKFYAEVLTERLIDRHKNACYYLQQRHNTQMKIFVIAGFVLTSIMPIITQMMNHSSKTPNKIQYFLSMLVITIVVWLVVYFLCNGQNNAIMFLKAIIYSLEVIIEERELDKIETLITNAEIKNNKGMEVLVSYNKLKENKDAMNQAFLEKRQG